MILVKRRKKPRDSQRSKVYKSDAALKKFSEPLKTIEDIEKFVKSVWKLKRVQESFPKISEECPRVKDGRGTRNARGGMFYISIPLWARSSDIVLHELAHTVTIRTYGYGETAAHGPEFCAVYLRLALYVMGREAHDALKAAMKHNKVRYKPKKARIPLSEERKAKLLETLRQARLIRQEIRLAA